MLLNTYGPRLKNCRGDEGVGIHVFAFSLAFKYCGPRLKDCRDDGHGGFFLRVVFIFLCFVFMFLSFLGVMRGQSPLIVDRTIQGQAKDGLKIAGVMDEELHCGDRRGL